MMLSVTVSDALQAQTTTESAGTHSIVVSGRVRDIGSEQLFSLDDPSGNARLVLVPRGGSIPPEGSTVVVGGVLRRLDQIGVSLEGRAGDFKNEMVVVARSIVGNEGGELTRTTRTTPSITRLLSRRPALLPGSAAQGAEAAAPPPLDTPVRPTALANLIDDLAGMKVNVRAARVVGVLSPRVFLIEPATPFPMMLGYRDRIAVLIGGNASLRVDPATLVGETVTVAGVARTPLGLIVSRDVTWPTEFTRDYMRRLEIRAAVLATSVQSPDGVELTAGSR